MALVLCLSSCTAPKHPPTGLWIQARRLLISQTYPKLQAAVTPTGTASSPKSLGGDNLITAEKGATPENQPSQGTGPSEGATSPGQNKEGGSAPVTLFGQNMPALRAVGATPPGPTGGAPQNLLVGSNIPPRYPNPNLIGSPKIQSPGGSNASGTPSGQTTGAAAQSPPPPPKPSGDLHGSNLPIDSGLQIATRDTTHPAPGQTSLEGTLGSTAESAVLPSFDAVYITLPGQDLEYHPTTARILDINVWFLPAPAYPYEQTATFRYYTQRYYKTGDPAIPELNPECQREVLTDKGLTKDTCKGPFPFANGGFLRVILCGKPNTQVLQSFEGSIANFMQKAWIEGDNSLWSQELCSERLYLDYIFNGADAPILFPLEDGKLYFITQFPVDYLDHTADYGELVPSFSGAPPGQYATSLAMNHYLHEGNIVQLITGGQIAGTSTDSAPLSLNFPWLGDKNPVTREGDEAFTNIALLDPSALANITPTITDEIPNSEICQPYKTWDPNFIAKETELFNLINEARRNGATCGSIGTFNPTNPLSTNPTLRCAARYHSKDMNDGDYFSHLGLDGSSELTRIFVIGTRPAIGAPADSHTPSGTLFAMAAENIAMGNPDPAKAVEEWLASEGHCANMMNPSFTQMGPAYYMESAKGPYWTLTFGTPWQ